MLPFLFTCVIYLWQQTYLNINIVVSLSVISEILKKKTKNTPTFLTEPLLKRRLSGIVIIRSEISLKKITEPPDKKYYILLLLFDEHTSANALRRENKGKKK